MRSDASALLQKLDRQNFDYRQFPDRYADLELWPIFEALLGDPRILERKLSQVELRSRGFEDAAQTAGPSVAVPKEQPLGPHFSSLLSAYGAQPAGNIEGSELESLAETSLASEPPARADLRTFLSHLARGQ